ncbi:OmpA family protein [Dyadobacter psychrotolerans]|uniref:OmpA-like domain-containing protein n=1 Tax=Dyadobacter psychrotolerans TaxID=2541721 RepID=A0A4R5E0J4_9BACT|nr:OmpA family protein [Dyadobacter psychrotolerans]TDE17093.1 hypothetical protein E0F88_04110 [Dyadobacter psychrotolerans]
MPRAVFCLFCMLCLSAFCKAQCLKIYGRITDAYSGKRVSGATILFKTKEKQQVLFETKMNGLYQISLPCDAQSVVIEAKGYRSQKLPFNIIERLENASFYAPLLLVATDKQISDQPYFQTDQHHVTLNENNTGKQGSTVRVFEIVDALTGKRVAAELCLFYTKTGARDCQQMASGGAGYETTFREADIVAIEVKSAGYQSYFGNLIMDQLDSKKSTYQIRLSRSTNLLSVFINADSKSIKCQLTGDKPVELSSSDGVHFFADILPRKSYTLQINDKTGKTLAAKTFSSKEGINFYALNVNAPAGKLAKPIKRPLIMQPGAFDTVKRVLYFKQSDYHLSDENKLRLDSIAAWLSSDPTHFLRITGHTDNTGPANLNHILSEYRARVAYHYLEEKGAARGQMKYTGAGSNSPNAANDIETNKIKNRRVEIQLMKNL